MTWRIGDNLSSLGNIFDSFASNEFDHVNEVDPFFAGDVYLGMG